MSSPRILALDTSTEACSAAVLVGDALIERFELLPRGHAERILPMIDEVLAEAGLRPADLAALSFCRGPGAFTGVRIACGVAQGLALGLDLPVLPLSTLQVLAQGARRAHGADRVLCAIDARMGEVYWGAFEVVDGLMQPMGEESVSSAAQVPLPADGEGWLGVGSGWGPYGDALRARLSGLTGVDPQALPRARDCLPLALHALAAGRAVAADQALPVYLRDKVTG